MHRKKYKKKTQSKTIGLEAIGLATLTILLILSQSSRPQAVELIKIVEAYSNYPRITSIADTSSIYLVSHSGYSDGFITKGRSEMADLGKESNEEIDDLDCDPGNNKCVANVDGKRVIVFTGPEPNGSVMTSITSQGSLKIKYVQSFPNSDYYFVGYDTALYTIQRVSLTDPTNYYSYASNNQGERISLELMRYIKGSKYIVGVFEDKAMWYDVTADRANATTKISMEAGWPTGVDFIQKSQRLIIVEGFKDSITFYSFPRPSLVNYNKTVEKPLGLAAFESSDYYALLTIQRVRIYQYTSSSPVLLKYTLFLRFSAQTTSTSPLAEEPGMKYSRALGSVAFWMGRHSKLTHQGMIRLRKSSEKNPSCGASETPLIAFSNSECVTCAAGLSKFGGRCHYHTGDKTNYPFYSQKARNLPSKAITSTELLGKAKNITEDDGGRDSEGNDQEDQFNQEENRENSDREKVPKTSPKNEDKEKELENDPNQATLPNSTQNSTQMVLIFAFGFFSGMFCISATLFLIKQACGQQTQSKRSSNHKESSVNRAGQNQPWPNMASPGAFHPINLPPNPMNNTPLFTNYQTKPNEAPPNQYTPQVAGPPNLGAYDSRRAPLQAYPPQKGIEMTPQNFVAQSHLKQQKSVGKRPPLIQITQKSKEDQIGGEKGNERKDCGEDSDQLSLASK